MAHLLITQHGNVLKDALQIQCFLEIIQPGHVLSIARMMGLEMT